ncbi:Flagellar hook-basal body complex protein FliE [Candidatus Filomicrobium marinum]|uniref:Flagellar hook-basal body complex protein FliE n=1 Tax=Candidatus Filomicrobium marinum TaxID=1608628 RepID=A0A0D6JKG1_9HYPH|nr:flagellar hook-basal body complex protein FliE [Candidatus Filomicrobium marinum]CFX55393.1 Flagellar hook-basal body complex protein FliE [Candidatus Filomicrobium marinum]CPR22187.1 Flagellar hook-basal body complex protein FliE [Candidatus Filomicrobium marinum]
MFEAITPTAPVSAVSGSEAATIASPSGTSGVNASALAKAGSAVVATGAEQDFTAVLDKLMTDAVDTLKTAEATSLKGVKGEASVQEVVEAVMAAEQTLQGGIAIRDKVVSAYLEISRMSI